MAIPCALRRDWPKEGPTVRCPEKAVALVHLTGHSAHLPAHLCKKHREAYKKRAKDMGLTYNEKPLKEGK